MSRLRAPLFTDRADAGRRLGLRARELGTPVQIVLGLARGGVPIAAAVATELDAVCDVAVARKIGAPGQPEFGIGAIAAHGEARYDHQSLAQLRLRPDNLAEDAAREQAEARRRLAVYRADRGPLELEGRDVLLVDDGIATGITARVALADLRSAGPRSLTFAAPVGSPDVVDLIRLDGTADQVICLAEPRSLGAVGYWYSDFRQTSDDDVLTLLANSPEQ